MKLYVDLTQDHNDGSSFCNYDGKCMFCDRDDFHTDYAKCYGERFGTDECPLKDRFAVIEIKDEYIPDYPHTIIVGDESK